MTPRRADNAWTDPGEKDLASDLRWLTRLTRGLTGNATTADDLAQDVWIAAAYSSPRPAHRWRSYVRKVAARLAAGRWREERLRREREERAAQPEAIEASAECDESREALDDFYRAVLREVGRLHEPYRTVVMRRYIDEQSVDEIAAATGRSRGTVRSQLSRGLALLRSRLAATRRQRRAWCIAALATPNTLRRTHENALVMTSVSSHSKLAAGLAAVAAIVGLSWLLACSLDFDPKHADPLEVAALSMEGPPADRLARIGSPNPLGRRSVAPQDPGVAETGMVQQVFRARVVDSVRGLPLEGFLVELRDQEGGVHTMTSDREGLVASPVPLPAQRLRARLIDDPRLYGPSYPEQPDVVTFDHQPEGPGVSTLVHTIQANVGPTIVLAGPLPASTVPENFRVRLEREEGHAGAVYAAEAPLRGGGAPWARFSNRSLILPRSGPWTVICETPGGPHRGTREIAPLSPSSTSIVELDWGTYGALHVELTDAVGAVLTDEFEVELYRLPPRQYSGRQPESARAGDSGTEHLRLEYGMLTPGEYELVCETAQYERSVESFVVRAGEVTQGSMALVRRSGLATISGQVHFRSGGAPTEEVWLVLQDPTHPAGGYAASLEREEEDPAGVFRFTFPAVPAKPYELKPCATNRTYRFSPPALAVNPESIGVTIECDDTLEDPKLTFEVRSSVDARPLPYARVEIRREGRQGGSTHVGPDGRRQIRRPKESFTWTVWAEGHVPRRGVVEANELDDSDAVVVELTPGWGEYVTVRSSEGPVPGLVVELDGLPCDPTDENGEVLLRHPDPPTRITVRGRNWTLVDQAGAPTHRPPSSGPWWKAVLHVEANTH